MQSGVNRSPSSPQFLQGFSGVSPAALLPPGPSRADRLHPAPSRAEGHHQQKQQSLNDDRRGVLQDLTLARILFRHP